MKWEKSSMITKIYFFPLRESIVEGPHKSIYNNFRGSTIFKSTIIGYPCRCCLPCSQVAHKESLSNVSTCKPRTKPFKTSLLRFLKFKWEGLRCQCQLKSEEAFDNRQIYGKPTIGFMSKVNISSFLLDFNNISFVILLEITLPSTSNNTWFPVPITNWDTIMRLCFEYST